MRIPLLLALPLVALFTLVAPGHTGVPPALPTVEETAPLTILASDAACDVVGTTWCLYGTAMDIRCKKNGSYVVVSFNSTSTNWPHAYHCDKTWNVDLTPLNLVAGDSLVWEVTGWATSGIYANRKITTSKTTTVQ